MACAALQCALQRHNRIVPPANKPSNCASRYKPESEYQSAECMSRHVFWGWHSFIYVPKLCCQRQNFCPYTITEKRMEASSSMIWFSYGWLKSIQKANIHLRLVDLRPLSGG